MKIERNMDLNQLAERMGCGTTREDAAMMREFLLANVGTWERTEDVPQSVWNVGVEEAVKDCE